MKVLPRRRPDVHTVTEAQPPMSEDIGRRQRRYLISMGVRTVCFVAAVCAAGRSPWWVPGLLIVGALLLPYVSVIIANAGREPARRAMLRDAAEPGAVEPSAHRRELGP